jgi:hypothetical protein
LLSCVAGKRRGVDFSKLDRRPDHQQVAGCISGDTPYTEFWLAGLRRNRGRRISAQRPACASRAKIGAYSCQGGADNFSAAIESSQTDSRQLNSRSQTAGVRLAVEINLPVTAGAYTDHAPTGHLFPSARVWLDA